MAKIGRQMVCMDCNEVFDAGPPYCPICASKQIYPLARWFPAPPDIEPRVIKAERSKRIAERSPSGGCAEMVVAFECAEWR